MLGGHLINRVLLVDSDLVSLRAMEIELRRAGYDVSSAIDGRTGLMIISELDPDICLVDLKLSDMSGLDVLRQSRLSRRVCILISRFGHVEDKAEAMKLGAFDCVEQPLNATLLRAVVHNASTAWPKSATFEPSHALTRWAEVVVRGAQSPRDMRTLCEWARAVAVSKGAIRNWCYTARLPARSSLQFMRVLRAIIHRGACAGAPEDLLNVVDRRTLTKLLLWAGGTRSSLPTSIDEFFDRQRIITEVKATKIVRAALGVESQEPQLSSESAVRSLQPRRSGLGDASSAIMTGLNSARR
jgi:CheY-like chemotaxis protein